MGKVKKTQDNLKKSSTKITTKDGKVKKKVPKQFTLYKCNVCNKKFTDKYNCSTHEKIHSTETYHCPVCPYKGKTKKYLARHRKQVHNPPALKHKCNVCGKMFDYKCNLREHVMVHTGEKPHKCDVCGKAFRVMFSLNNHMHIHKNEKPYKCSFCAYACRDNSTLRKHENRHMGVVKSFPCKICPKKFPEKAKLKYHISEVHLNYLDLDLRRYNCDKCGKAFKCKYVLNNHVQAVHEKLLKCDCPVCGVRLSNKNNLSAHLRTHFDERPYACTHLNCHKRFKDKSSLKKHAIIHSPQLHHPCQICGALFARAHRLDKHVKKMHNPREKWAECDYCGVSFYSKNYLIKHITRKHCKNKEKFVCDKCGLVTFNKPSIVMHLKYGHGNEKDIKCKICKTKYKRFIYLKAHYLKTHNIRYKSVQRKKKEEKPEVEVKVEPVDEPYGEIQLQLLDVHKQEIVDEDEPETEDDCLTYSKHVLSEDLAECILNKREVPENQFEEFLFDHVFHKRVKEEGVPTEPTQNEVNEEQREEVTQKIKEIIRKAQEIEAAKLLERRRKKHAKLLDKKLKREAKLMRRKRRQEIYELERVRQMYNERMRAAEEQGNKKEPAKTIKFFKQKTTEKTSSDKQTEKTNNNHNKEDSGVLNSDSLDGNTKSRNDNNGENVPNSDENLFSAWSDHTNENDNIHERSRYVNDSNNEMIGSLNTDNNTNIIETIIEDPYNDTSKATNDNNNVIIDKNSDINARNDVEKDYDSDDRKFKDPDLNKTKNANDSINNKYKDGSINDEVNDSNDGKSDDGSNYEPNSSEDESTGNKRLKFKTHQCYICFKLYPTKEDLISHCQSHFDICNVTTLAKCPVCAHVASANIAKHMLKKHGMQVKIPYNRITDRKDNSEGSRYCYEMDDGGTMEIIPSVKILNHHASVAIDKKNRERRDKTIAKTRLVKKGTEWVVEHVTVKLSYNELPEFTEKELSKLGVSNSYADRLGQLSRLAKKKGIKMVFPCNSCDKICQNFSALRLHGRRHDPNKKPFAPKKYKRNAKPTPAKKKPEVNLENRLAKPQPIIHKHKCDENSRNSTKLTSEAPT